MPMQSLLKRQLKRFFGSDFSVPAEWEGFLAAVDSAYTESEVDRKLAESSMEFSSQELIEANADLVKSREMFRLIAESTKAIPFTLDLTSGSFPYIGSQGITNSGIPESEWNKPGALDVIVPRESNHDVRQRFDECISGPFEFVTTLSQRGVRRSEVRWTGTCETVAGTKYLRGLMLDITEFRRMGRELAAAQSLSPLAGLQPAWPTRSTHRSSSSPITCNSWARH